MPPPIQSQSGSKAALISWTVITSILFVVATVLAIFAHVDRNKKELELAGVKKKLDSVIRETDIAGDVKTQLEQARTDDPNTFSSDMKLMDIALTQRNNLVRKIAGATITNDQLALANSDAALKDAAKIEGVKLNTDNLLGAVKSLTTELKNSRDQLKATEEGRDALSKKIKELEEGIGAQIQGKDKDIETARTEVTKAQTDVTSERDNKDKQIADIQVQSESAAKSAQDDLAKLQAQLQESNIQHTKLEAQIKALQGKLRDVRQDVNQIVRQSDAKIIRLGGQDIVYIDLGAGDQVSSGMAFEVYDRIEGVPKPGDPLTDDNLPRGKASIEIVNVSPGTSECRIVRRTPGSTIVEGDLCVNAVYDRSTKYNFLVYGNFDLDRNNQATPQDADVVKRLITSWGGNVQDKLTADTDFVVLGKVPEIPTYTAEELERPEIQFEQEKKKQEVSAYEDTLARAVELNIPVLNQNRFLYFVGYYKQSAR